MNWGRFARLYDWQLALERPALCALLDLLMPTDDDELLDLGTGTGAVLQELAQRRQRPRRAIGVDSSPAMLGGVPPLPEHWQLVEADAAALPFADGSFDIVTASYLLHVVADSERECVVGEARRVLRAGGRFATITPTRPRRLAARLLYAPLAAAAERAGGPLIGLRPLDPRPLLERSGFRVAAGRYVGRGYPSLCVLAEAV